MEIFEKPIGRFVKDISSVPKYERRNSHIGRAVNENFRIAQPLEGFAELREMGFGGVFEIDRDMDVLNPEGLKARALIRQGIFDSMGRQVDHVPVARVPHALQLRFCGLPTRQNRIRDRQDVEDPFEGRPRKVKGRVARNECREVARRGFQSRAH